MTWGSVEAAWRASLTIEERETIKALEAAFPAACWEAPPPASDGEALALFPAAERPRTVL